MSYEFPLAPSWPMASPPGENHRGGFPGSAAKPRYALLIARPKTPPPIDAGVCTFARLPAPPTKLGFRPWQFCQEPLSLSLGQASQHQFPVVLVSANQPLDQFGGNLADVYMGAEAPAHETHHPAEERSGGHGEKGFQAPETGQKRGKNHQSDCELWTA